MSDSIGAYLAEACTRHAAVLLKCCIKLDDCFYYVLLSGFFERLNGMSGRFAVNTCKILPDAVQKDNPRAEFRFSLSNMPLDGVAANIRVSGIAMITAVEKEQSGRVKGIALTFSATCNVRRLRHGKRYSLNADINHFFKVVLPRELPTTQKKLADILRGGSEFIADKARIINISRGGACICLPEEQARPLLSDGSSYVFFFTPDKVGTPDNTYLFVAKRLGLGDADCPSGIPVRLNFVSELDMKNLHKKVLWRDIQASGSERLQTYLEHNEIAISTDPEWEE